MAHAISGVGNWGLVDIGSEGSCHWVLAQYRRPGNVSQMDANVYGYREPQTSCDHSSPWQNFGNLQERALIWNSTRTTLCATGSWKTIPSGGTGGGYGWGFGYNRSGLCTTETQFGVEAQGVAAGGATGTSLVWFTF